MDNPLLAIATTQPATIAEVIAALEAIDGLLPETDGLKWFNWLYLTVTKAVDLNIGSGTWHNPAWLTQLDVVFAGLYLSALAQWLTPGETAPKCWSILFDARDDAKLARIQFALAGINAHIDHDLSEAVVETCRHFNIAPVHQSPEYLDYTQVNSILDPIVDQAKAQLLTGLLGDNLPSINYVENMAAAFGLSASREAAWTNGEMLFHAEVVPGLGDRFLDGLDDAATLAARGLLAPVGV
jgi:hypothetical protein